MSPNQVWQRFMWSALAALACVGVVAAWGCGDAQENSGGERFTPIDMGFGSVMVDDTDPHPEIVVPGQEGRIDGSVWGDGQFNSPEAKRDFCASYTGDDAWFCDDGLADKANWRSVEFHGLAVGTNGGTCYGPRQKALGGNDCFFPAKKNVEIAVGFCSGAKQAVADGMLAGMLSWDGKGSIDVVRAGNVPPGQTYLPLVMTCTLTGGALGVGGLSGSVVKMIDDAPTGPFSGNNLDDFSTVSAGVMNVNDALNKSECKRLCNGGSADCTAAQLGSFASYVGTHEMGHVLGFAHFDVAGSPGTIMNAFRPDLCTPSRTIGVQYGTALTNYEPGTTSPLVGSASLEALTPH